MRELLLEQEIGSFLAQREHQKELARERRARDAVVAEKDDNLRQKQHLEEKSLRASHRSGDAREWRCGAMGVGFDEDVMYI